MEEKAAKLRPAGTKILAEQDRIATLEKLIKNKNDVTNILNQLPISMRTENLKKQKIELEHKLEEIEKGISTFSRKMVYVKIDQ